MVLVGAIIVAGIETVWGGREAPGDGTIRDYEWPDGDGPMLAAGDELGRFYLGSTVVLVSEQAELDWSVDAGDSVRVCANLANRR